MTRRPRRILRILLNVVTVVSLLLCMTVLYFRVAMYDRLFSFSGPWDRVGVVSVVGGQVSLTRIEGFIDDAVKTTREWEIPYVGGRRQWLGAGSLWDIWYVSLNTLAVVFGLFPTTRGAQFVLRHCCGRRSIAGRHCPSCGYDLRATPDRCPECGNGPKPAGRLIDPPRGER